MDLCHLKKMLSLNPNYKNTEAESCSGETLWRTTQVHMQYSITRLVCVPVDKQDERCSQIAQKIEIGMPRCLDTSSKKQMPKIMEKIWRAHGTSWTTCVRSTNSRIALGKTIRRSFFHLEIGWDRIPNWDCIFVHRKQGLFLSVYVDDIKMAGKEKNMAPMRKKLINMWILTIMCTWDALSVSANRMKQSLDLFCWNDRRTPGWHKPHAQTVAWSYDMEGHAQKWVERYCESANKKVEQLYKVSSPCLDDHQFKQEELESVGEFVRGLLTIVLKCLCLAGIGRPDILWSFNKLARPVTKWTQACDRRLARPKRFPTVLSCGRHGPALQTGLVSILRLCWRSWGLEVNPRRCLVFFWEAEHLSHQLDVQETIFQLHRVWNHFSGCWIMYGWVTGSRTLWHGDWSVTFNWQRGSIQTYKPPGNWCSS